MKSSYSVIHIPLGFSLIRMVFRFRSWIKLNFLSHFRYCLIWSTLRRCCKFLHLQRCYFRLLTHWRSIWQHLALLLLNYRLLLLLDYRLLLLLDYRFKIHTYLLTLFMLMLYSDEGFSLNFNFWVRDWNLLNFYTFADFVIMLW